MANWPVLAQIVAALYADASKDDWAAISEAERAFATAAINAHPAHPA